MPIHWSNLIVNWSKLLTLLVGVTRLIPGPADPGSHGHVADERFSRRIDARRGNLLVRKHCSGEGIFDARLRNSGKVATELPLCGYCRKLVAGDRWHALIVKNPKRLIAAIVEFWNLNRPANSSAKLVSPQRGLLLLFEKIAGIQFVVA